LINPLNPISLISIYKSSKNYDASKSTESIPVQNSAKLSNQNKHAPLNALLAVARFLGFLGGLCYVLNELDKKYWKKQSEKENHVDLDDIETYFPL